MSKHARTLCDWDKDERIRRLDEYRKLVEKPKYFCQDCGRVAADKKSLCVPLHLDKKHSGKK